MKFSDALRNALIALALLALPAFAATPKIHLAQGELVGKTEGQSNAYLGIPFAAAPVGDLRWKPPTPAPGWRRTRVADHFAASCQQSVTPGGFGPWTSEYVVSGSVSEDCLYLNVWTPQTPARNMPVLVWIHGGAFTGGSGSVPIYNGASLAAHDIIVVTINYRLGILGFFSHPFLDKENAQGASGNYGLLDQVAALKWVKSNIRSFGGDPNQVTIAGQSAGSVSTLYLISSPLARGLFTRAIAESGAGIDLPIASHADADAAGVRFAEAAGISSIAELRKLSPEQLANVKIGPGAPGMGPSIDGLFFKNATEAQSNTNDVPVLTGLTANESSAFDSGPRGWTLAGWRDRLNRTYGSRSDAFAAFYPATDDATAKTAGAGMARDRGLAAMYLWAEHRQTTSKAPIYAYLWTHVEPGPDASKYSAFHSSEIPYVFGTLNTSERPFTAEDYKLSELAGRYWVNFVSKGDPNGPGLPKWPRLTGAEPKILELGGHTQARPLLPAANLDAYKAYAREGGILSLFWF